MILTVRIEKHDQKRLEQFAHKQKINRSQAVKELLNKGFMISQLQEYKEGKLSLGRLAEILEVPMVEALGLVSTYNAHQHMPRDYITDAREYAKRLKSK